MAEVSGGRVRGRPWLRWMDGVKVALGKRGVTVDAARQCGKIGKSGEPYYICKWMNFTPTFLLGPVRFRTTLPCSGGYHLERGGMPLHDAVGINCKKGAATEHQGADMKYLDKGVYVDDNVCVIWLDMTMEKWTKIIVIIDMTNPPWWMEKVMVYYYYVTASLSNSIPDQLTHLMAEGIYQSGEVPDSATEQSLLLRYSKYPSK